MSTTDAISGNRPAGRADFDSNEPARLAAVRRYDILDTLPDGAFDRIVAIAARRFRVPIAIISIVDEGRIWFKSHHGVDFDQTGRDTGLCASAILSDDPHIVTDASIDTRTQANTLVAGSTAVRFYAGVPLTTSDGHNLGMLCVMDTEPGTVFEHQIDDLRDLAGVVMNLLELRISGLNATRQASLMAQEIDHRVMNSLQHVASLLSLQSRSADIGDAKDHLMLAANRVNAVAHVHRHIFAEVESAACIMFLQHLCDDLGTILDRTIVLTGDDDDVPTRWMQPIGLLTNELVTNAAKHGVGEIAVDFRRGDAAYILSVCDEGRDLPKDFNPSAASTSLGMRVVIALAGQLYGKLSAGQRDDGSTRFAVTIPA